MANPTDFKFAPLTATCAGILAAGLAGISSYGWNLLWPFIITFTGLGLGSIAYWWRRQLSPRWWAAAIATSLLLVSVIAVILGVASGDAQ